MIHGLDAAARIPSLRVYTLEPIEKKETNLDFTNSFISFSFFFFFSNFILFIVHFRPTHEVSSAIWNGERAIERDSVTFSIRGGKF